MNQKIMYRAVTALFSAAILFSAMGELTRNQAVIISMETLGLPLYILIILGIWKVLGIFALWAPVPPLVKEWAYVRFFFNLPGALISLVLAQAPFIDDWIAATVIFTLWLASFVLYRQTKTVTVVNR
jgi:hypothetical protein